MREDKYTRSCELVTVVSLQVALPSNKERLQLKTFDQAESEVSPVGQQSAERMKQSGQIRADCFVDDNV
jgi:hypothetical protein